MLLTEGEEGGQTLFFLSRIAAGFHWCHQMHFTGLIDPNVG